MTRKDLHPVYPNRPLFYAYCCQCGKSEDSDHLFADLSGEAFRAYWCGDCAGKEFSKAADRERFLKACGVQS